MRLLAERTAQETKVVDAIIPQSDTSESEDQRPQPSLLTAELRAGAA